MGCLYVEQETVGLGEVSAICRPSAGQIADPGVRLLMTSAGCCVPVEIERGHKFSHGQACHSCAAGCRLPADT